MNNKLNIKEINQQLYSKQPLATAETHWLQWHKNTTTCGNDILKGIGIILLIFSTFQLPSGYYTFLRLGITYIAVYFTYNLYKQKKNVWAIIFLLIGILFNPIFPIYLDKETWVILDIGTSIIFFISLITNLKSNGHKTD